LDRVNSARNFTNKLWNAGKFVLFNLDKVGAAATAADWPAAVLAWALAIAWHVWLTTACMRPVGCAAGNRHAREPPGPQVDDAEWQRLSSADYSSAAALSSLALPERWVVSTLHRTVADITAAQQR
jgi:valyl-tRNA synthetase